MQTAPRTGPERIGRSLNDQAASDATSDLCIARMPKNLLRRDPFPLFGSSLVCPKQQGDMQCPTSPLF